MQLTYISSSIVTNLFKDLLYTENWEKFKQYTPLHTMHDLFSCNVNREAYFRSNFYCLFFTKETNFYLSTNFSLKLTKYNFIEFVELCFIQSFLDFVTFQHQPAPWSGG